MERKTFGEGMDEDVAGAAGQMWVMLLPVETGVEMDVDGGEAAFGLRLVGKAAALSVGVRQ